MKDLGTASTEELGNTTGTWVSGKAGEMKKMLLVRFPYRVTNVNATHIHQICANRFREIPTDVQFVQTDETWLSVATMYHNKLVYILNGGGSSGAVPSIAS